MNIVVEASFKMAELVMQKQAPVWSNAKMKVRRDFLDRHYNADGAAILELGAFASPTFLKSTHDVLYADRLSTDQLRHAVPDPAKRAAIVGVDFVVPAAIDARSFDRKFDLVVANHVIEHAPDLIGWLIGIASILRPAGRLFMAVPDRDYTFDKGRDLTTLRELMLLHEIGCVRPPLSHVVDHRWASRPITQGDEVWNDTYWPKMAQKSFASYGAAFRTVKVLYESREYVDCHCNVFTSASFAAIVSRLESVDWFPFRLVVVAAPARPYNEFLTVLTLKSGWVSPHAAPTDAPEGR